MLWSKTYAPISQKPLPDELCLSPDIDVDRRAAQTCERFVKRQHSPSLCTYILVVFIAVVTLPWAAVGDPALDKKTRECITRAKTSAQIAGCELDARKRWQARLANNDQALRFNLGDQLRRLYVESQQAWENYRQIEYRLIDQTLGKRVDGLARPLTEGAKTEVIRRRVEQQAALLNSLPFLRDRPTSTPLR